MNSFLKAAGNFAALLLLLAAAAYVGFYSGRRVGRLERLFDRPKIFVRDDDPRMQGPEPLPPPEAYQELQELDAAGDSGHLANSKGW